MVFDNTKRKYIDEIVHVNAAFFQDHCGTNKK